MKSSILFASLYSLLSLSLWAAAPAADEEEECPSCKKAAEQGVNAMESTAATKGSVYDLESKWHDQHNKERTLANFRGKPVIMTMGYASCKFACPRLMADLMGVERKLTDEEKKSVQFAFVSIDPEKDTPTAMGKFFDQYHVDQQRWFGLTGKTEEVLELSVALGIRYRKLDSLDFAHSNRLLLLDSQGAVVKFIDGLGEDPAPLLEALRKLLVKK